MSFAKDEVIPQLYQFTKDLPVGIKFALGLLFIWRLLKIFNSFRISPSYRIVSVYRRSRSILPKANSQNLAED
jgi:hypothetical protein